MNLQYKCGGEEHKFVETRALLDAIFVASYKRMLKMYCKYKSVKEVLGPAGWIFGSFSLRFNTEKKGS